MICKCDFRSSLGTDQKSPPMVFARIYYELQCAIEKQQSNKTNVLFAGRFP